LAARQAVFGSTTKPAHVKRRRVHHEEEKMMATSRARLTGLVLLLAGVAAASPVLAADTTETWRYDFGSSANDGRYPAFNDLVLASDGNYYGTTSAGGANNSGTIFRLTPGGNLTTIHALAGGAEGCTPTGGLGLNAAGQLVGIASGCGASGAGTIFRSSLNGTFVVLHTLTAATDGYNNTNCSGRAPLLRASDNFLVGTSCYGGPYSYGTVWELAPNGRFNVLHAFNETWADGLYGRDVALADDETIIGVTDQGGIGNNGTIYKITPNGAYSQLYHFTAQAHDGNQPQGISIGPDGGYYGFTYYGGQFNQGVVFQFLNGKFKVLHNVYNSIVREGGNPYGKPVIDANGVIWGNTYNSGALFRVTKAGVYSTMYVFETGDGSFPDGAIALAGNNMYASTRNGGSNNLGTIAKFAIGANPPSATITATPSRPHPGEAVTIKWKGTNVNMCTASANAGGWSGTLAKSGTQVVTAPSSYGRYYYWVGCTSASGNNHSSQLAEITVTPAD
jgi:uncharacterized repeat protein (TIGR03803 family)